MSALGAAGPARAGVAGSRLPTTTNHPDLVSAQLLGGAESRARFCFDKVLQNPGPLGFPTASAFMLGGYDAQTFTSLPATRAGQSYAATSAALDPASAECVIATFPSPGATNATGGDYTIASVLGGTVLPNGYGGAAGDANFADSVSLGGSVSHSGAGGHTTAPDLQAVAPSPSGDALDFTFDQNVNPRTIDASDFFLVGAAGATSIGATTAAPLVINGNVVRVFFPAGRAVAGATVGGALAGAASGAAGNPDAQAPPAAVAVAGRSGTTPVPRVIAATLTSHAEVDYTFDQKIALVPGGAANAILYTANASPVRGLSDSVIGPTTIRVTFPAAAASFVEEFTYAAVQGAPGGESAVATSLKGAANLAGGAAVGGNAGALAAGFTSGPDARSATFNPSSDTVTIDFDQRVDPAAVNASDFVLRAKDGTALGPPAATRVVENTLTPGDARVILDYVPGTVRLASLLEIDGPPNTTASPFDPLVASVSAVQTFAGAGFAAAPNVQQILAGQ